MNPTEDQLQQVEVSLEQAKNIVERADAYNRLTQNNDFKFLIEDCYFNKEPVRITMNLANSHLSKKETEEYAMTALNSISLLNQFFTMVIIKGEEARKAVEFDEMTREELLQEVG